MAADERGPMRPVGLNHLVINVRDLEESHRFWTEILGFKQVGEVRPRPGRGRTAEDALLQRRPRRRPHEPPRHRAGGEHRAAGAAEGLEHVRRCGCAVNHIAIALPDREAWLRQLDYLQRKGVKFDRRIEHGMTHSLYIHDPNGYGVELLYELPREVWEGDIDAALNYSKALPTEGAAALEDQAEGVPVFQPRATRTGLRGAPWQSVRASCSPGSATRTRSPTPAASATSSCRA